nr:MerC domain-containing protein [uncultured Duganella sp.]
MNKLAGIANVTGMAASALCLLHCLVMPLLLLALPALGWAAGEELHQLLIGVALAAALLSLGPGYLAHRDVAVPLLGAAGLTSLAGAVFVLGPVYGAAAESTFSVLGAVLLCAAHLRNGVCCRG